MTSIPNQAEAIWHDDGYYWMPLGRGFWNPLTDDGDALRLAVRLLLTIQVDDEDRRTYVVGSTGRCIGTEPHGDDLYAATRRAIVRAAAEIGREMK